MEFTALAVRAVERRSRRWRLIDVWERLLAATLLLLTLPIVALACIVIVAISRRSPLIAHQRIGQGGRTLWILKMRTMWQEPSGNRSVFIQRLPPAVTPLLAPEQKGSQVTSRFAALCRRFSIDELPQLWQVVRGEMALVGPRPLTQQELDTYYGTNAGSIIISEKPGISGLWQVRGRSRLTYAQRRRLDLFLIRKWSAPLYFKILLATAPRVLAGKDAW